MNVQEVQKVHVFFILPPDPSSCPNISHLAVPCAPVVPLFLRRSSESRTLLLMHLSQTTARRPILSPCILSCLLLVLCRLILEVNTQPNEDKHQKSNTGAKCSAVIIHRGTRDEPRVLVMSGRGHGNDGLLSYVRPS